MLTVEEEQRILRAAPPYLRVGIFLLAQTGGRTYSEGFSLRWDQVDLDNAVIHLSGELKTDASAQPVPLTSLACQVLRRWKGLYECPIFCGWTCFLGVDVVPFRL